MSNIVIGIEGLVGSGKTSICRELIKEIPNTVLLNGGNLYRAIVYCMIKNGKELEADEEALQSKESSLAVSTIGGSAENKNLFIFARNLINDLKKENNVIVSGRSVMKIYPDCDYHFFIVADLEERIKRKCSQYNNKETPQEIRENITKRDELQRKAGFYEYSSITTEIDVTNCKSAQESTKLVLSKIKMPELV